MTLDLSAGPASQSLSKKTHRASKSITKGIRALVISNSSSSQPSPSRSKPSSPETLIPPAARESFSATSRLSTVDNGWDVIDELPMRWATDYVPLAPSSMRNPSADFTGFELHRGGASYGRLGSILAVALKSSILIFEAPLGERAFRFVKVTLTVSVCSKPC